MARAYAPIVTSPTQDPGPMPELPEVEIASRNLQRWTGGRLLRAVQTPDEARFEGDAAALAGARFEGWRRVGKYLVATFEGGQALLSHLGMTGQWVADPLEDRPHQRVVFELEGSGPSRIALVDPRRFGWTWILASSEVDAHPRLQGLGPDPLDGSFSVEIFRAAVGAGRAPLKSRLLDQRVVAGLGNIAISDIAWRASIHPHRPPASLTDPEWERLHQAVGAHLAHVLEEEAGEEIVYLGYTGAENPFLCYGREGEPCSRCATPLARAVLSGRATFYCPICQEV